MRSYGVIKSAILDFHFFSGSQKITESDSILTVIECTTAFILQFCKIKLKQYIFIKWNVTSKSKNSPKRGPHKAVVMVLFSLLWHKFHQRSGLSKNGFLTSLFGVVFNKTKTEKITQRTQTMQWTNQNSRWLHVAYAKRGKSFASASRLAFGFTSDWVKAWPIALRRKCKTN